MEIENGHGDSMRQSDINMPEILENVLSRATREDLLQFRLTCHLWNKECLYHLRKAGGTLALHGSDELQKYREFVQTTNAEYLMPIKLIIGDADDSSIIEPSINFLVDMYGETCISDFQIWDFKTFGKLGICSYIRILHKIAKGVQNLNMQNCRGKECDDIPLLNLDNLYFPSLKKIWRVDYGNMVESDNSLVKLIIDRSPKFEHLCTNKFLPNEIPLDRLKTLELWDPESLLDLQFELNKFRGHPIVEHFIYDFGGESGLDEHLVALDAILNAFAGTLKSVDLNFPELQEIGYDFCFPAFPKLEYLRVQQFQWIGDPWFLNPDRSNFTPELMPALRKVRLPVGMYLADSEFMLHTKTFLQVTELIFEVMDWLFHIDEDDIELDDETAIPGESTTFLIDSINHLLDTFPNAVKIGVVSPHEMSIFKEWQVKRVIRVILESKGTAIEELAIDDYRQDYLGQILNEMDQGPVFILKNVDLPASVIQEITKIFCVAGARANTDLQDRVTFSIDGIPSSEIKITLKNLDSSRAIELSRLRKLKLTQSGTMKVLTLGTQHTDVESSSWLREALHLNSLAKYCPNLRELQISSIILSSKGYQDSWTKAREIEVQFPNWNIKVDLI